MSDVAILVLTEDSSKWASETVEQVCRRILDVLVPQFGDGDWLSFAPATGAAREAMRANMWKSRRARDQHKILRLCRDIATHVLRDDGFVFFHFDGDAVWAQGVSENVARFDAVIRAKVRDLIRGELREDSLLEPVMDRFVHLVPHYSIETWLFANVAALRQLDVSAAVLEDWEADLTRLDTALQPKKLLRIAAEAYPTLARKLAADHLLGLGTSFCDAVTRAGACGSLVVRLRHRWPAWVRAEYGLPRDRPAVVR